MKFTTARTDCARPRMIKSVALGRAGQICSKSLKADKDYALCVLRRVEVGARQPQGKNKC